MTDTRVGLRSGAVPLAVRMRPRSLDEVAGQRRLLAPGSPLVALASDKTGERGNVSVILWGPPGTGKTTLAQVIAHSSGRRFVELSAVSAGVRDVRQVMEEAQTNRDLYDLGTLVDRAVADERGLGGRFTLQPEARAALVQLASGDARRALTALEAASVSAAAEGGTAITAELVSQAVDRALLRYDRQGDEHYDVISAFIKSVRGSDADAALHYLARMIEAGEDPRFIARRLIISASEDVGMADPVALQVAVAAADAVQFIGMPEGRIPLAEATVYLATAPKSNASYLALDRALADVRAGKIGRVPKHLRDAHYPGAKRLGHGKGYVYPHDDELGVVPQQYLPDPLRDADYYRPTEHGFERDIRARWEKLRDIIRRRPEA